jgi:rRNA maturation endonuclease Nob1
MTSSSDEQVMCAMCDTEWSTEDHDACPNCGSTKVWDMAAAFQEAGFDV